MSVVRGTVYQVDFERRKDRDAWRCLVCAALVGDAEQHASWHATLAGHASNRPRDPGISERAAKRLSIHIDERGWPPRAGP